MAIPAKLLNSFRDSSHGFGQSVKKYLAWLGEDSAFVMAAHVLPTRFMKTFRSRSSAPRPNAQSHGVGQLSLVEHALCPLDVRRVDQAEGFKHESRYQFSDKSGRRRTARVRVVCPLGLTPTDEFYLWGLLALALAQPQPTAEFHATPHYCLRQLGVIDQHGRRGGRQYRQFAESLERLAAVSYQNDGFYDPVCREHRRVSFGFLSYNLPLSNDSSRAWRITWDGVFLEMANTVGGHLRFDLAVYRELDPAARRLFLLLCKLFRRQRTTPRFDLQYLGVQVMGFSPTLARRDLKVKVARVVKRLTERGIVADSQIDSVTQSTRNGSAGVMLSRGSYFRRDGSEKMLVSHTESPLVELMQSLGLDAAAIGRCLRTYPTSLLQQWLDITLAARERHGASFFRRSAAAYFINNVQNAVQGKRTPPDWWHDLQRQERRAQAHDRRQKRNVRPASDKCDSFEALTEAIFQQFRGAGQSDDVALANANQFINACRADPQAAGPAALLKILK